MVYEPVAGAGKFSQNVVIYELSQILIFTFPSKSCSSFTFTFTENLIKIIVLPFSYAL